MAWSTPKTNWTASRDSDGIYQGDYFNYTDFNRIKENLEILAALAEPIFGTIDLISIADKSLGEAFYPSDMNNIETNLYRVNTATVNENYGMGKTYEWNGKTPTYLDFNRIESAILDMYIRITNMRQYTRKFTWNFIDKYRQEGL